MKRLLTLVFLVLAALVLIGATAPDDEPRNVRVRAQLQGDSIVFRLQWNAPPRGAWDTPVEGYDWELRGREGALPTDSLFLGGHNAADNRRVDMAVAFDCAQSPTYFTARVRATGDFNDSAPWGSSDPFTMACNDSPPGPPEVDLDTIPRDTTTTAPDSLVLLAVDLGHVGWEREGQRFSFTALGDVAKMCAFAYRDGEASLASRGSRVATMDSTQVITRGDVVNVVDAPPLESACWYLTAMGNGSAELHLCTTDCPATLARFGLPHWMRWPLLISGVLLWVFGAWAERRKKRVSTP